MSDVFFVFFFSFLGISHVQVVGCGPASSETDSRVFEMTYISGEEGGEGRG